MYCRYGRRWREERKKRVVTSHKRMREEGDRSRRDGEGRFLSEMRKRGRQMWHRSVKKCQFLPARDCRIMSFNAQIETLHYTHIWFELWQWWNVIKCSFYSITFILQSIFRHET